MFVACGADSLPVFGRGDEGCAAYGFGDDGSDVAFFFEYVFDVVGAFEVADAFVFAEGAVERVWRGDVFGSGE